MEEGPAPEQITVKALSMLVPESVVQQNAEKKRVKRGILGGSEERVVFGRTLYLPYLDFTYQYSTEKGFLSKHSVVRQGSSVFMALREVKLGIETKSVVIATQ